MSGELIYLTFLHYWTSTLVLYPENIVPETFYFQWPARTKIQRLHQNILKEGNGYQKYLMCPDLWDRNFQVVCSEISLYKVDLKCVETVKSKPSVDYSGLLPTQTQSFSSIWLDNNDYLIMQWKILWKTGCLVVQKKDKNQKRNQGWGN